MNKREELSSILENVEGELTSIKPTLFYEVASNLCDFLEKHGDIEGDSLLESVAELAEALESLAAAADSIESALSELR